MKVFNIISLLENVRPNYLYHNTFGEYFLGILKDGFIGENLGKDLKTIVCLTRDPDLNFGNNPIQIVLKRDALIQTHRIVPHSFLGTLKNKGRYRHGEWDDVHPSRRIVTSSKERYDQSVALNDRYESEERVYRPIPFTSKYIERVVMTFSYRLSFMFILHKNNPETKDLKSIEAIQEWFFNKYRIPLVISQ